MRANNRNDVTPKNPDEKILKGIGILKDDTPSQAKNKDVDSYGDWRDGVTKILTSGLS